MASPSYIGRYEVREEIAQGGFATVLKAWDEELESLVALKIIHSEYSDNQELQSRFIEEARLLRRVRSPNVVTVHDVGRLQDGRPYLVMDFADRKTLAERLALFRDRPADIQSIAILVDALADGLSAIHEAGVVHRDIKPANILFQSLYRSYSSALELDEKRNEQSVLIQNHERIVIGDLGIAKDLVKQGAEFTILGGTPLYQPPEQIELGSSATPKADIYAATALLFQCLTGTLPPPAHAISERLEELPEEWRPFVAHGMALKPNDRFASIEAWRSAANDILVAHETFDQEQIDTESVVVLTDCPYKGLAAYQPEDAEAFFGRERLIDELVHRMKTERVLIVGGPSGSGKSSLVRAGLLPALKAGALSGSADWPIALMTPGRDPLIELYDQITGINEHDPPSLSLNDLLQRPSLARRLGRTRTGHRPMVILIDQFEELFTLTPEDEQASFIDALSAMTDPADSQVKLIITIRADFYDYCARLPWLAERISSNQVLVGPMTEAELRRAVSEPARQAGYHLERGLIEAIIEQTKNEAGSLPLIAHALVETWVRRRGNVLTYEGFEEAGGVAGAISQTADETYQHRFDAHEQGAARRLFLRLVASREGGQDTRRIVSASDLEKDTDAETLARVVEILTEARLLTVDENSVQIAHEALLRTWPRLRGWIETSRDDLRFRQRITRAATEWDAEERNPDLLYRGTPLLAAADWIEKNPDQLDELERIYIDASIEAKERAEKAEAEKERRGKRLRRLAFAVLAVFAIGASGASVVAFRAFQQAVINERIAERATEQAQESFGRSLGAVAKGLVADDPLLALALAAEALERTADKSAGFNARSALLEARQVLAQKKPFLLGSPIAAGDALSIAIDNLGATLASGLRNGSIRLFDIRDRLTAGDVINGHDGGIQDLDFSTDSNRLASVGDDGAVKVWDVANIHGAKLISAAQSNDILWNVEFDPLGQYIVTAGEDGSVRLWQNDGSAVQPPLTRDGGDFLSVIFGEQLRSIIGANGRGEIYGWKLPSGEALFPTISDAHTSDVWELVLSPDARRVATSSSDGSSVVFDAATGAVGHKAFVGLGPVSGVAFSADGRTLFGGGDDGRIQMWDLENNQLIGTSAAGHSRRITKIRTNLFGNRIATLGADQQIRLWSYGEPHPLFSRYALHDGAAKAVAFSPDGEFLAVSGSKGTVYLWRLDAHTEPLLLLKHKAGVWAAAFSPDGKRLVTADRDGNIVSWSVESGVPEFSVAGKGGSVWSVGYFPDGVSFFVADESDVTVRSADTGDVIKTFAPGEGKITHADLSADGGKLAVSTVSGKVQIWDVASGTKTRDISVDDDVVWSVVFNAEATKIAAASSDEVVKLYEVGSDEKGSELTGHAGGAMDIAFLEDGASLAVVDRTGQLHLWDVKTERRLSKPVRAHNKASWRLAVHPDGVQFATSGDDGNAKLWNIFSRSEACRMAGNALDDLRQLQYLGETEKAVSCSD